VSGAGYTNCYIPLTLGLVSFCLFGYVPSPLPKPVYGEVTQAVGQPQFLPITAKARLAGRTVQLEVARTPEQQAKGMMWRTEPLADDRGMAFHFASARPAAFWMKNCFVPLDMIFILKGRVQKITTASPCVADPCPIYPQPPVLADLVIELRAHWARDYGLKVGDGVVIEDYRAPMPAVGRDLYNQPSADYSLHGE